MSKKTDRERAENDVVEYLQTLAEDLCERDGARRSHKEVVTTGRDVLFAAQLQEALRGVFAGRLASPDVKVRKPKGQTPRTLNLVLSDTHYGSNLDPRETGHSYGPVEEARRTAYVVREAALYKLDHRDETKLNLHLLGDMIQGQLHDPRDGAPLAEQVGAAMRVLIQAVRFLAVQFPRGVCVRCRPGNHGRNAARHRDRAVNQKWDSIETMIYLAIKEACADLPNVEVLLGYEPEYYWEDYDLVGLGTHGDTVIKPGYPGKSIDVEGMSRQVDKINNARVMKGHKPLSVVVVGHVHVGSMTHLPGGTVSITNGCLIPPDAYAHSIGIFETTCGQYLWESVPGHAVGDSRFLTVGSSVDEDESLDKVIKPFRGL